MCIDKEQLYIQSRNNTKCATFIVISLFVCTVHYFSDIDECTTGDNNCDPDAECSNTEGNFTCACPTGFVGDGVTECSGKRKEIIM